MGIVAYCFYWYLKEQNEKSSGQEGDVSQQQEETTQASQTKESEQETMEQKEKPRTKELALSLLRKLGCQLEETETERIRIKYQGIVFLMEAVDDCMFVNLIWPWCHSFSKFDIDEFARVRQVVNSINMQGTVTVFYGISDSDEVAVHIKKHFLLVSQIPAIEDYMRLMFDSFFSTARRLDLEIEKVRMQECEK